MTDPVPLESTLTDLRRQLSRAAIAHDFQQVGHGARELLISIAQAVFDPATHRLPDGTAPSNSDAKAILDSFFANTLPGKGNEEARKLCRAAVDLANAVQHDRAASYQDAALAVEACGGVLAIVMVLAGQRLAPQVPWQGVQDGDRFFSWDGPALHALADRDPIPVSANLIELLKAAGWIPRFGLRAKLAHHLSRGHLQVWETDCATWRRAILAPGDGDQILLISKSAA